MHPEKENADADNPLEKAQTKGLAQFERLGSVFEPHLNCVLIGAHEGFVGGDLGPRLPVHKLEQPHNLAYSDEFRFLGLSNWRVCE